MTTASADAPILQTVEFRSRILGNTRSLWLLPPPASSSPLPPTLCILLDGEYYTQRMQAPRLIHRLQREGSIPPVLCLFVSHLDVETRWQECPCNARFADAFTTELLPWAEAQFGVACRSGEHLIGGLSFTGLAAAYTALRANGSFGRLLCQSASFWWADEWLTAEYAREPRVPMHVYLSCGDGERATRVEHRPGVVQMRSQLDANRAMRDALARRGYPVHLEEFAGGHELAAWERDLPHALRFLLAPPREGGPPPG